MSSSPNFRLTRLLSHLSSSPLQTKEDKRSKSSGLSTKKTSHLTITDSRNGKTTKLQIKNGTILSKEVWNKFKLRVYDPGYTNTAAATSRITFIDGPKGLLTYRGYPIEQLANKSSFLEVSYLLLYGELPTQKQYKYFSNRVMTHSYIHQDVVNIMKSFRYDAHPMGMLVSTIAGLGTVHPEANPALAGADVYLDANLRNKQIHRLLGSIPTLAAFAYRQRLGRPFVYPSHENLSYTEQFLYMIDRYSNTNYRPHPELAKVLDVLFILHADHEFNCSTSAMRHLASSGVDVYTALSAATGALYGRLHGGANEAVLRMLSKIGDKSKIPQFISDVKNKKVKLMGFGHRVYKNYDPRAKIVRKLADRVFNICGREPLIEIAEELEKHALSDPYFIKRKLYPNVDFYSGLIYKAMGFPPDFFTVLFAIPRTVGWLAHWNEFLHNFEKENKIVRPRQVYLGEQTRNYVELNQREFTKDNVDIQSNISSDTRRRFSSRSRP